VNVNVLHKCNHRLQMGSAPQGGCIFYRWLHYLAEVYRIEHMLWFQPKFPRFYTIQEAKCLKIKFFKKWLYFHVCYNYIIQTYNEKL